MVFRDLTLLGFGQKKQLEDINCEIIKSIKKITRGCISNDNNHQWQLRITGKEVEIKIVTCL